MSSLRKRKSNDKDAKALRDATGALEALREQVQSQEALYQESMEKLRKEESRRMEEASSKQEAAWSAERHEWEQVRTRISAELQAAVEDATRWRLSQTESSKVEEIEEIDEEEEVEEAEGVKVKNTDETVVKIKTKKRKRADSGCDVKAKEIVRLESELLASTREVAELEATVANLGADLKCKQQALDAVRAELESCQQELQTGLCRVEQHAQGVLEKARVEAALRGSEQKRAIAALEEALETEKLQSRQSQESSTQMVQALTNRLEAAQRAAEQERIAKEVGATKLREAEQAHSEKLEEMHRQERQVADTRNRDWVSKEGEWRTRLASSQESLRALELEHVQLKLTHENTLRQLKSNGEVLEEAKVLRVEERGAKIKCAQLEISAEHLKKRLREKEEALEAEKFLAIAQTANRQELERKLLLAEYKHQLEEAASSTNAS